MCGIREGPFSCRTDAIRRKAAITALRWREACCSRLGTDCSVRGPPLGGGGRLPQRPLIDEEAISVTLPERVTICHLTAQCCWEAQLQAHIQTFCFSQPQPYPGGGPPMWMSALSLWGSAFWIRVNTKRAAGPSEMCHAQNSHSRLKPNRNGFVKEQTL